MSGTRKRPAAAMEEPARPARTATPHKDALIIAYHVISDEYRRAQVSESVQHREHVFAVMVWLERLFFERDPKGAA